MALTKITSRILDSSGVTTVGTISTGVWQGTAINQTYLVGQSGTNTGDETLARINALDVTELGTISSGVWQGSVIAEAYLQNQSGTNTGDQTNISGNAGTATLADEATKLATARNIGGVLFDGSSAIDLPGVNISGNQNTSGNSATVTNGVYIVGNQTIGGAKTFSGIVSINGEGFFRGDSSGNLRIQGGTTATEIRNNANNSSLLTILNGGNVGIGTTSPSSKLHIRTSSNFNYEFEQVSSRLRLSALNDARSANVPLQFAASEFNFVTGNVGIGTTSPVTKLHVQNPSNINDNLGLLLVENTITSGSTNSGVNVKGYHGTSQFMQWEANGVRIGSRVLTNGGAGDVIFTAGADSEKMRITSAGQIQFTSTGQPPITNSLYGNMVLTTNAVGNFQRIRFDVGTTPYWGLTKLDSGNFAITGGSTWNDHAFSIQYSTQNVGVGMSSGVFPGKFNVFGNSGTTTPGVGDGIYVGPYQGNSAVGSNWAYSNAGYTYTDFCSRYDSSSSYMRFVMKASATPVYAMTIRGNGAVTKPLQPAFSMRTNANLDVTGEVKIPFNTNGSFSPINCSFSSGTFTATTAGRYLFTFTASCLHLANHQYNAVYFRVNNNGQPQRFRGAAEGSTNDWFGINGATIIDLAASDYVELYTYSDISTAAFRLNAGETTWCGYLL